MRIAYVIDYLYSINGGTERQLFRLIEGMVVRGHEVTLFVLRETAFTKELKEFPCAVRCLGIPSVLSPSGMGALRQFRRELCAERTDVVHGFFNDVALVLPPLMIGTGIRTYTSRRDMGFWYTPARLALLRLFRFAKTRVICNSAAVADHVHEKEWKPREAIVVIHNGLDPVRERVVSELHDWTAAIEGEPETVKVILVANVRPIKCIEDLIKAAAVLREGRHRIRYCIVGHLSDWCYHESLLALLREHRMEDAIRFVGAILEPRTALARFDIGVLTSASEGLSNTIMEYLDAGLPVVVSRVGGNLELVTHGQNGFLYEAGRYQELAERLGELAGDAALRRKLATNAKLSMRRFRAGHMIELHEKEYAHAAENS